MPQAQRTPDGGYAQQHVSVHDTTMAYVDTGDGPPVVFIHGNPTSSYLWRNVIPHIEPHGRCLAPDLVGMGNSGKMPGGGYRYLEHVRYLDAWFEALGLTSDVILVLHDWGGALGFHRAHRFPEQIAGIAYLEAMVRPRRWTDLPPERIPVFQGFRTPEGAAKVLEHNVFVEKLLFEQGVFRALTETEKAVYRAPYPDPESRKPTLMWPCEIPFDGEPADNFAVVETYAEFLAETEIPKLFINTTDGHALLGPPREFCRTWKNQTEVTIRGRHYVQEDSPDDVGAAIADFVQRVRSAPANQ